MDGKPGSERKNKKFSENQITGLTAEKSELEFSTRCR
jgi:hypothetical protein